MGATNQQRFPNQILTGDQARYDQTADENFGTAHEPGTSTTGIPQWPCHPISSTLVQQYK